MDNPQLDLMVSSGQTQQSLDKRYGRSATCTAPVPAPRGRHRPSSTLATRGSSSGTRSRSGWRASPSSSKARNPLRAMSNSLASCSRTPCPRATTPLTVSGVLGSSLLSPTYRKRSRRRRMRHVYGSFELQMVLVYNLNLAGSGSNAPAPRSDASGGWRRPKSRALFCVVRTENSVRPTHLAPRSSATPRPDGWDAERG